MFSKKIAAMIIAVVIMITTPLCSASAGSVTAMLRTNMTYAESALLGNTTNYYKLIASVSSTSDYSVEFYVYKLKDGGSGKTEVDHFSYADTEVDPKTYYVSENYTMAMCTLYGNLKDNPKRGCYANGILSNN